MKLLQTCSVSSSTPAYSSILRPVDNINEFVIDETKGVCGFINVSCSKKLHQIVDKIHSEAQCQPLPFCFQISTFLYVMLFE